MAKTARKSKKVKSLGAKALTSKQAKIVTGGADLLPAVRQGEQASAEFKLRGAGVQWKV
jgi:hypothetical protein